jgi:hypothetical protein
VILNLIFNIYSLNFIVKLQRSDKYFKGGGLMNLTSTPNRLISEKSPYLLQHAYNPVDWFPWGQEAFDKAKSEDKPIFLSIGYS